MTTVEKQKQQQAELHARLWEMANALRGSMDASEFKSYILGLIFYRYLSEKVEKKVLSLLKHDTDYDYNKAWNDQNYHEVLQQQLRDTLGYVIEPQYLFSSLLFKINVGEYDNSMFSKAIKCLSESTIGTNSQEDFEGLFEDMDLDSSRLGREMKTRSALIAKIITGISEINFDSSDSEIDILGDAYEYLIGQFAASAGKKAGEFYTPQQVSKILAKIVSIDKPNLLSVYDPCCGSGSLLLRVSKETKVRKFYGQEFTGTTYNLARMNMLLHDVPYQNFSIYNGDTLEDPHFKDQLFEAIVSNPPYSAHWSANEIFLDDDRFSAYGRLAPKTKADWAFVLHMIYHLKENGTLAVVLPHGVLFRGAAEEIIRKTVIKRNYLDAVIGLPSNLFYGTTIPTCILVFKKNKPNTDILFIEASKEFLNGKNQNHLRDEDVEKIVRTYSERKDLEKYSHLALESEIKENEYNLNIPRYVDTFEEEEPIDLAKVQQELKEVNVQIKEVTKKLNEYLKELGLYEIE